MLKKSISMLAILISSYSFADLESLDNTELAYVDGQAGADLSLLLSLNHQKDMNGNYVPLTKCNNPSTSEQCRMGISFNNRQEGGNKLWIVLKGIQGTINLQYLGLDGVDLSYRNKNGALAIKPAIQLSYDASKPIQIHNYGFDAIAMAADYATGEKREGFWHKESGGSGIGKHTNGRYDYTNPVTINGQTYNSNSFDHDREIGFLGMKMHGNLALQGTVKMFGCDGSHPRC